MEKGKVAIYKDLSRKNLKEVKIDHKGTVSAPKNISLLIKYQIQWNQRIRISYEDLTKFLRTNNGTTQEMLFHKGKPSLTLITK